VRPRASGVLPASGSPSPQISIGRVSTAAIDWRLSGGAELIVTISVPDAAPDDLARLVEDLESAGIEFPTQGSETLKSPVWHDIGVAIGSSGLLTTLYHVIQAYLKRASGQRLTLKSRDVDVTFRGGSPRRIEGIVRALAEGEAIPQEKRHGAKTAKKTTKKKGAKKQTPRKTAKRPARKR
jgi:hypothetical protein